MEDNQYEAISQYGAISRKGESRRWWNDSVWDLRMSRFKAVIMGYI